MKTKRPIVAMDEAGNTGQDLLNQDQPIFTLASIMFSDKEMSKLVALLKSKLATEIHFKTLKRTISGRKRIISFLNDNLISNNTVKLSVYHKKYMIIAKALDLLVEPLFYEAQINFYEKGLNVALANLHYYMMPIFCETDLVEKFCDDFVNMIRRKDKASVQEFYDTVKNLRKCCKEESYGEQLDYFRDSESIIGNVLTDLDIASLDPAFSSFFDHIAGWGDSLGTIFDVIHDESKIIDYQIDLIRKVLYKEIDPIIVGYDKRTRRFPLLANDVKLVSSKKYPAIQLADILASSIAYWAKGLLRKEIDTEFWEQLNKSPLEKLIINSVWPSKSFAPKELGMEEEGGVDPVDFVAGLLAQRRKNTK